MLVSQIEKYENARWLFSRVNRNLKLENFLASSHGSLSETKHDGKHCIRKIKPITMDPGSLSEKNKKNEPKYCIFP
jgi:hypothetical protein